MDKDVKQVLDLISSLSRRMSAEHYADFLGQLCEELELQHSAANSMIDEEEP